ncbi:MAG: 2Fe-2S iron-sulfur cluster binding domain-containing protein [Candidatus Riflebacteria bacterium]|nr:2Fe-2S iron-sulfur cluster binding domain-containing protein [Candidatus Riflebacteria bacterium]
MQALLVILIINAFVLILCALVAFSGQLLRQSGDADLVVNKESARKVGCGQSLLPALAEAGIFLPAACGGKGTCGRCEIKVIAGGSSVTPMETIILEPQRLQSLARLACQVKVRQNIEVEVPAGLLAAKFLWARLESAQVVAEEIKTLQFNIEDDGELDFKPGQYIQIFYQMPWERVLRAYSISSSASTKKSFSLDIQRISGGLVSNYLHQLQPGDQIEVSGPFGEMYLTDEQANCPIILVAGGVGLAPLRAILEKLRELNFPQPVWLFHGARSRKNLYCEKYFHELAQRYASFKYLPALSNPMLEEGWVGSRGLIHELLEQQTLTGVSEAVAFVCGPSPMMQAVTKVLVAKGLASDRILTDPFDFS